MVNQEALEIFIERALLEDVGDGDHTTLSCIPANQQGSALLKVKEGGILAGVIVAKSIFRFLDPNIEFHELIPEGSKIRTGDVAFEIRGNVHALLKGERLALNCMQRMSGIATLTHQYVEKLKGYRTKLLDTRKTTPGFRFLEKEAVRIGGGQNHRMGLFDMILLKDNHIDFCGCISKAILKVDQYKKEHDLNIPVELEVRSLEDIREVLSVGRVNRIMFDNFSPEMAAEGVQLIDGKFETESSGNITLDNIENYAMAGVDFVSSGAIIHHAVSLDLSLKAIFS